MSRAFHFVAAVATMLLVILAQQIAHVVAAPSPAATTATSAVDPVQAAADALAAWPGGGH